MSDYLVHMEGPDDIEYHTTWAEACSAAHAFNESVLAYNARTSSPGLVQAWAIPYRHSDYEERWRKILA